MAKLNQVVAVVSGKKTRSEKELGELYKILQKTQLFEGVQRTYRSMVEEGETFPPEKKEAQYIAKDAIANARGILTGLWDSVLTVDAANCEAKADIKIDNRTILSKVPITHLLWLEKQITDLSTFVQTLPVLSTDQKWKFDETAGKYASEASITSKSKKVPKTLVKYEATKEHPAQTEVYHEDMKVGEWTTVAYSGAVPAQEKNEMIDRLTKLKDAVKFAREEANMSDVVPQKEAEILLDYVFRGK